MVNRACRPALSNRGKAFAAHAAAVRPTSWPDRFSSEYGRETVLAFAADFRWLILTFHKLRVTGHSHYGAAGRMCLDQIDNGTQKDATEKITVSSSRK